MQKDVNLIGIVERFKTTIWSQVIVIDTAEKASLKVYRKKGVPKSSCPGHIYRMKGMLF